MKIRIFLIATILTGFAHVEAQKLRTLYYTSSWELTTKDSAEYYRICQIDTIFNKFLGEVNDFNMQGQLLMRGIYENGIKNGLFSSTILQDRSNPKENL